MPSTRGTPVLRVCEICGIEFYARPQARSCSDKCRKALSRRNELQTNLVGDTATIYALQEGNGNIYYIGSTLDRAVPRGHVLPPGAKRIVLSRVAAEWRYVEEQNEIDKIRAAGHNLVNKNSPRKTGIWK